MRILSAVSVLALAASLAACATDQERVVVVPTLSQLEQCKASLSNNEPPSFTIQVCQAAAAQPGVDPAAHAYLADAYLRAGARPQAKGELQIFISLTNSAEGRAKLARLHLEDGELVQAQTQLEAAIASSPSFVEARYLLGEVGRLRGDCRLGLSGYDGALRLAPAHAPSIEGRAALIRLRGCAGTPMSIVPQKGGSTLQGGARALKPGEW